jgi:hypothetical protein
MDRSVSHVPSLRDSRRLVAKRIDGAVAGANVAATSGGRVRRAGKGWSTNEQPSGRTAATTSDPGGNEKGEEFAPANSEGFRV